MILRPNLIYPARNGTPANAPPAIAHGHESAPCGILTRLPIHGEVDIEQMPPLAVVAGRVQLGQVLDYRAFLMLHRIHEVAEVIFLAEDNNGRQEDVVQ